MDHEAYIGKLSQEELIELLRVVLENIPSDMSEEADEVITKWQEGEL